MDRILRDIKNISDNDEDFKVEIEIERNSIDSDDNKHYLHRDRLSVLHELMYS